MNTIKISNPIKTYAIENEDGKVLAELKINTQDDNFLDKFTDLQEWASNINVELKHKLDKSGISEKEEIGLADCKEYLKINNETVQAIIDKTEELFGKGLIKQMYAECYEQNPDFIPSISLLSEFYNAVMPLVSNTFKGRTAKYSVNKKR